MGSWLASPTTGGFLPRVGGLGGLEVITGCDMMNAGGDLIKSTAEPGHFLAQACYLPPCKQCSAQ